MTDEEEGNSSFVNDNEKKRIKSYNIGKELDLEKIYYK